MESQMKSLVVATPKQDEILLLRQANAILVLKQKFIQGVHYGPPYPGSKKDTLLKPGAELVGRRFGLRPDYGTEALDKIIQPNFEDLSLSFILFRYRCRMVDIETGIIVGEAIGSCSSLEDKYRWRWAPKTEVPTHLDIANLRTKPGKAVEYDFAITQAETTGPYGKPSEHWQMFNDAILDGRARVIEKTAKSGKKMKAWEIDTTVYRLLNENPLDLLNTVDKMAQKRAFVSAVIVSTGASAYFAPGDDAVTDLYDVPTDDDSDMVDSTFEVLDEGAPSSFPPDIKVERPDEWIPDPNPSPKPPQTWATAEAVNTLIARAEAEDGLGISKSEIKRLLNMENLDDMDEWDRKFASRADAGKILKENMEKELAKTPPAQPKNPISEWSAEDLAIAEFLFMDYALENNAAALALVKAKTWAEFKNLNAARNKLMMAAIERKIPMIASGAKYIKTSKATYVEFTTPTAIRLYGRDMLRELGTEWFLYAEAWQPGETYQFSQDEMLPLKVTWEKKGNYFQATAVSIHSDALETA